MKIMSALERLKSKEENETFYKKVGKRYIQVNNPFWIEGLGEGFFLVHKREGSASIQMAVYPERVEAQARNKLTSDKLVDIISEASKARPAFKLTEEQNDDWNALLEKHPELFSYFQFDSMQGMATAITEAIFES